MIVGRRVARTLPEIYAQGSPRPVLAATRRAPIISNKVSISSHGYSSTTNWITGGLLGGAAAVTWLVSTTSDQYSANDGRAEFNKKHYSRGLNANFLCGTTDEVISLHAGPEGRFEKEGREIARHRQLIVSKLDELVPGGLQDKVVADVGAGTGLFMIPFSAAVGTRGEVVEIELSRQFADHLESRKKTDQKQLPSRVKVVQCTDKHAGVQPDSVDVIFICDVYHHLEYPLAFMNTLQTALRKGGRLVVIDFHRDDAKITSHAPGWIYEHVRADQSTFRREIEQAGFRYVKDVDIPELSENYTMVFTK